MSAFLFGNCGGCRRRLVSASSESMLVMASVPYMMGWEAIIELPHLPADPPTYYPFPNSAGFKAGRWNGPPVTIFRTLTMTGPLGSSVASYTIWGKLTGGLANVGSPVTYALSDPYSYADATANAIAQLGRINFGGSFPVFDYYGVRTDYTLCYASEASQHAHPVGGCAITFDEEGNPIYAATGGAWNPINGGFSPRFNPSGDEFYDGGVIVAAKSMLWSPRPLLSMRTTRAVAGPGANSWPGGTYFNGSVSLTAPTNLAPGEHVFTPADAPFPGSASFSWDAAPLLGG